MNQYHFVFVNNSRIFACGLRVFVSTNGVSTESEISMLTYLAHVQEGKLKDIMTELVKVSTFAGLKISHQSEHARFACVYIVSTGWSDCESGKQPNNKKHHSIPLYIDA